MAATVTPATWPPQPASLSAGKPDGQHHRLSRVLTLTGITLGMLAMLLPLIPWLAEHAAPAGPSPPAAMAMFITSLLWPGLGTVLLGGMLLISGSHNRRLYNTGAAFAAVLAGLQCILLATGMLGRTSTSTPMTGNTLSDPITQTSFAYAPAAMLAIGALATAAMLMSRGRSRRTAFWISAAGTLLPAADLAGSLLALDLLFNFYSHWAMHWLTACGLLPLGACLMHLNAATPKELAARPDRRIIQSASWLITVLLGIAGISSFAMLKADLDKSLRNERFQVLETRAQLYDNWLNNAMNAAQFLSSQPALIQALQHGLVPRGDATQINRVLDALRGPQFRAIAIQDDQGRTLAASGRLEQSPYLRLPLNDPNVTLLWRQNALLESAWNVHVGGDHGTVTVLIQSELDRFTRSMLEAGSPDGSQQHLCGGPAGKARCLSGQRGDSVLMPAPEAPWMRLPRGVSVPGTAAQGVAVHRARTEAGESLITAVTQVGTLGLTLSMQIPSREAYAPLRRYTLIAAPIMLLLVILATAILNYQVAPIATRLYRSERVATSANAALVSISEQLRFSQERLSLITNNIPALISYLDADLYYRFANAYYYEILGLHPEELIGRHAREVLGEEMFNEISPWFRQVLSGLPAEYQVSRMVDGSLHHFNVCYFPDYDPGGKVQGFYSLSHDVTERKRVADALEESERRMRTITDNIPALISQFDTGERCRFANRRFLEYFEVPRQKAMGMPMRELIGEDNYRSIKDELATAIAGLPVTFERAFRIRGETRYISTSLMPQFDAAGMVAGCYGLTQDLTARKTAELGRLRSEERLRTITDNMPALIAYFDIHGRFQFANRTWEDWLTQRTHHLIGYGAETVLERTGADPLLPFIRQAIAGERIEFETELALPRGNRHVRGAFLPHVDEESQMLGVYGMIHDITALKLVELKLSQLARFDSLTGIPNRNLLLERMARAMSRVRRERTAPDGSNGGGMLAVLFLDLDRFKEINDTHGHAAGDAVLKEFSNRLVACVRETDTVGRLAGDEFIILLEGLSDKQEACRVAGKILAYLEEPFNVEGSLLNLSTSIGIVVYCGEPDSPESLMRRADSSLYEAKHLGRNRYQMSA